MSDAYSDYCELQAEKVEAKKQADLSRNRTKLDSEKNRVLTEILKLVYVDLNNAIMEIHRNNYGLAGNTLKDTRQMILNKLYDIGIG